MSLTVDARDKNNRVKQFKVVTTILDVSIDGEQIGDLYERRWSGEVDIRSIKSTMQMDILRCNLLSAHVKSDFFEFIAPRKFSIALPNRDMDRASRISFEVTTRRVGLTRGHA